MNLPPNMLPKEPPRGRKVEEIYRDCALTEWVRKFPFWQRIAILFGANLIVHVGCFTRHKIGNVHFHIEGKVSKHTSPDEVIKDRIRNMIVEIEKEQKKP